MAVDPYYTMYMLYSNEADRAIKVIYDDFKLKKHPLFCIVL